VGFCRESCEGYACCTVYLLANDVVLMRLRCCIPGQPRVQHQSSSSVMKHCRQMNAPRASPEKANSKSSGARVQSAASANVEAREKSW
jgi:hypothetical protein